MDQFDNQLFDSFFLNILFILNIEVTLIISLIKHYYLASFKELHLSHKYTKNSLRTNKRMTENKKKI